MSNLEVGDRVYHNYCRAKGKIISGLPTPILPRFTPRRFIIVRLDNGGRCATWRMRDVKPIITVRG